MSRSTASKVEYALSLKQPWATLLVQGYKSIEIRSWPTSRRGRILIHAARVPDARPEAWSLVPAEFRQAATELLGGIIGAGDLVDCRGYRVLKDFASDRDRHLNDLTWFRGPVLYGFVFANQIPLPFRSYSGWMRFFPVNAVGSGKRGLDL